MARPASRHALLVATGILLSRIFGLIRQRVLSHYLGLSDAGDAFAAAFRIPNILQNLLGEGVLSASFIPVYARLRAEGDDEEAQRVANAVFGLLALVTSFVVLAGVAMAEPLTNVIALGFPDSKHDLTVRLVRILFPGAGLLVLSAWCLGVLNSHRRFLLAYTAPVVWNLAIIAALLINRGSQGENGSATVAAIGSVLGSALQFLVQLPVVLVLLGRLRPALDAGSANIRKVIANFGPVLLGRGATQISAFVDTMLASLLGRGAVAGLTSAQVLYTLPVSLFGMSVAASELPAMSSETGSVDEVAEALRARLGAGLRRIAFFVIPTIVAFLFFGGDIAGALFQTGRFAAGDSRYVWAILAGSTVGLLAGTMGRLYGSCYYALRDAKTPLRFAVLRVALTTVLGYLCSMPLPHLLGIDPRWGVVGLTASAGAAGWIEFLLLKRGMGRRIGATSLPGRFLVTLWAAGLSGAAATYGVARVLGDLSAIPRAIALMATLGLIYLSLTFAAGVPESRAVAAASSGGGMREHEHPDRREADRCLTLRGWDVILPRFRERESRPRVRGFTMKTKSSKPKTEAKKAMKTAAKKPAKPAVVAKKKAPSVKAPAKKNAPAKPAVKAGVKGAVKASVKPVKDTKGKRSGLPVAPPAKPKAPVRRVPKPASVATRRKERAHFRELLLKKRQDLMRAYAISKGDSQAELDNGTEDYVDHAVNSYAREFLLSLTEMDRKHLLFVEEALNRIDRGEFGYCQQCGEDISPKRLEVQPWARHCVRCQELEEKGLLPQSPFHAGDEDEPAEEPEDVLPIDEEVEPEADVDEEVLDDDPLVVDGDDAEE